MSNEPIVNLYQRIEANIHDLLVVAAFAFSFGLIRIATSKDKMPFRYNMVTLFSSVLIGTLAGQIAFEIGFQDWQGLGIASICSLLSRDIIYGILNKQFLADLAKRAAENIVDKTTR